jgi:hypothetical protein
MAQRTKNYMNVGRVHQGYGQNMSLHNVEGVRVVRNPRHQLPRDDDMVKIYITYNGGCSLEMTLFAEDEVKL